MNTKNSLKRTSLAIPPQIWRTNKIVVQAMAMLLLLVSLSGCYTMLEILEDDGEYKDTNSFSIYVPPPVIIIVPPEPQHPRPLPAGDGKVPATPPQRESGTRRGSSSDNTNRQDNTRSTTTVTRTPAPSNPTPPTSNSSAPARSGGGGGKQRFKQKQRCKERAVRNKKAVPIYRGGSRSTR